MGILPLARHGAFVSISDAGSMKVCENDRGQVINDIRLSNINGGKEMPLKAMIELKSRNLIAVADASGNIYLMDDSKTDLDIVKVLSNETSA
jgi:WD40 repeat protein